MLKKKHNKDVCHHTGARKEALNTHPTEEDSDIEVLAVVQSPVKEAGKPPNNTNDTCSMNHRFQWGQHGGGQGQGGGWQHQGGQPGPGQGRWVQNQSQSPGPNNR